MKVRWNRQRFVFIAVFQPLRSSLRWLSAYSYFPVPAAHLSHLSPHTSTHHNLVERLPREPRVPGRETVNRAHQAENPSNLLRARWIPPSSSVRTFAGSACLSLDSWQRQVIQTVMRYVLRGFTFYEVSRLFFSEVHCSPESAQVDRTCRRECYSVQYSDRMYYDTTWLAPRSSPNNVYSGAYRERTSSACDMQCCTYLLYCSVRAHLVPCRGVSTLVSPFPSCLQAPCWCCYCVSCLVVVVAFQAHKTMMSIIRYGTILWRGSSGVPLRWLYEESNILLVRVLFYTTTTTVQYHSVQLLFVRVSWIRLFCTSCWGLLATLYLPACYRLSPVVA